ncbi:hypothetical protein B0H13DRAFT_2339573 [Mycena leptocephala]|nr:hypothetical protein B0H13DRAFT_2339573 [Mycena leptocephala]
MTNTPATTTALTARDELRALNEEAAADNVFVRAVPKTPSKWWPRTPTPTMAPAPGGLFSSAANLASILPCQPPNQRLPRPGMPRKGSKAEALAYYRMQYEGNLVQKWVEFVDDTS